MVYLPTLILGFLVLSLLCRFYLFPLLFSQLSNFRLTSISPLSVKGLEYRLRDEKAAVIPTLRVERAAWTWGGWKEDGAKGLIVLKLEGVSLRVRHRSPKRDERKPPHPKTRKPPGLLSRNLNRLLSIILHLFLHHWPSLARVVSLQIADSRLIFDDLSGLELTVRDIHLGVKVLFEGKEPQDPGTPASPTLPSPSQDTGRAYPLASPPPETGGTSPLLSPHGFFTSFTLPGAPKPGDTPPSRIQNARRTASTLHSRMSSTANAVWSRAIGRAHGSVIFMTSVTDVALILPYLDEIEDHRSGPRRPSTHLSHRASIRSFNSEVGEKMRRTSMLAFMKPCGSNAPRYALPSDESGYETLGVIDEATTASLALGFGPKKGLLGEDTLRTSLALGKIHTSLGAMEKVNELAKSHRGKSAKDEAKDSNARWSPKGLPRIILRALESVSVSLNHLTVSQYLAASDSRPRSASSSATDISDLLVPEDDVYTVSLELDQFYCQLDAADSSTNYWTHNAFGVNSHPESKVRGVGFKLAWGTIGLQCIAPGEEAHEKSQLLQMRSADFEGCSTWRPKGWSREELLFAGDPNLALIVGRGGLASVDIAADLPLLCSLKEAWLRNRPPTPANTGTTESVELETTWDLPPRVRLGFDVGHTMVVVADPTSEDSTTLTMASEGLRTSCFTSFADIVARRNRTASRAAFKAEEELRSRREQNGLDEDYSQPSPMLKPQYRRHFSQPPAKLRDDFALSMRADASLELEPLSFHLTLSGQDPKNPTVHHLGSIGRLHTTLGGDIWGKQNIQKSGAEIARLMPDSRSFALDLGIDQGIKLDMWNSDVVDSLITMIKAHQPSQPKDKPAKGPILAKLPSGISVRVSLGLISLFVGHPDPNPDCKLNLTRGLWLQTQVTLEYAYYGNRTQTLTYRHHLSSATRAKLRLPEDIKTQALAQFTERSSKDGRAALFAMSLTGTIVKAIFHGERFVNKGGIYLSHEIPQSPKPKESEAFVGWEFMRPKPKTHLSSGHITNALPPLDLADSEQATRPLLKTSHCNFNFVVCTESRDAPLQYDLSGHVDGVDIVSDLSHVYCALLATLVFRRMASALKRTSHAPKEQPKTTDALRVSVTISHIQTYIVFPAGEHMVSYFNLVKVYKQRAEPIKARIETALMYVPSPRQAGAFEELVRLRGLEVTFDDSGPKPSFRVDAEALRVRIPFGYVFAKLVLNVQLAVKSMKLLVEDLGSEGEFLFVRRPTAEAAKQVPPISINIKYLSLEAKDNPIETRLNLIWRVGMNEQQIRNSWEDTFERKQQVMEEAVSPSVDDDVDTRPGSYKLSKNATVSYEEARYRLDWFKAQEWRKRIDSAIKTQRLREQEALRTMESMGPDRKLPIQIAGSTKSAPLFRAAFEGVQMVVKYLGWSRDDTIKYMGDVSAPFDEGAEFSLFIPLHLTWKMTSASLKLRDYPLDLINIPLSSDGKPSWELETPFIIAEELQGDDSVVYIPSMVIPADCGARGAAPFRLQIAKTIMPVKTYCRPVINILTDRTTEFTWGNSYSPAISDFARVIESLSHPPRDPSPRIGFWDKFRLILHWKVTIHFSDTVHLHLKGSSDPYATTGHGAGFALSWSGGTKVEINQPNPEHETIQITAEELLIAIPDLSAAQDDQAIGRDSSPRNKSHEQQDLIERRYTKPCAQYQNGVRVGFGFVFERTCRPWSCKENCGSTENLLHRQCRIMEFKKHQDVILRSPAAIERDDKEAGHPTDSYEGFRSDFVHFSVSNVSPLNKVDPKEKDSTKLTGLHFSPRAFAHFFAWWKLFDSATSLPIRQGKLFPDSPPPSKKFGKSLGTIKYRFDLAHVFVSHVYAQVVPELWAEGKHQALGVKARFGRFRADAHQRAQEKTVRHEKLHRTTVVVHKPFYAADLLLDDIELKGIRADFRVDGTSGTSTPNPNSATAPRVTELGPEAKGWFNFFDFIDVDRKPFDRDPELEIVDIGDCPEIFFSKRVKARQTRPDDDQNENDSESVNSSQDSRLELESSKFGHERSHICYLGAAAAVGPTQVRITKARISELEDLREALTNEEIGNANDLKNVSNRLNTLYKHLEYLSSKESRHMDDDTFQTTYVHPLDKEEHRTGDISFENTVHVHCPRIILTNTARNLLYKYYFSSRDRKREEYTTSHASLRGVRESIAKRLSRDQKGLFEHADDIPTSTEDYEGLEILSELQDMLCGPNSVKRFEVRDHNLSGEEELRRRSIGIPEDCMVKPQNDFLILKPQVGLRSNVDQDSIVLLTMEEISFKGYRVMDKQLSDVTAANVLDRNYVAMKGLQAFYPSETTMGRQRGPLGVPRGLDFVPLEIFLDVRSEATEYDRIVLKSDAAIYFDRFNHLRMPRGLDWPDVKDDEGYSMNHLRRHQDLFTIIVPRLSVAATSKHYTALYNVVTDLLLYVDPKHRQRSERIDNFIYAFDRKDRNPQKLILDLFTLQQEIRHLAALERGYAANMDLLDESGREELFKIRTDQMEGMEQLFTVFEAISVNQARDDAKAALKTASRMDVRVGGIAWHMLRDDLTPLIKLDIEGTLYSIVSNKDGSTDNAAVFGELSALNSSHEAMYPEVLARYEPSGAGRRKNRDSFASIFMSTMAAVGGIQIVRHLAVNLHPVRFKLEERLGHEIVDYIFNDRVKRRRQKAEEKQNGTTNGHRENGTTTPGPSGRRDAQRTPSGMEMPPLNRTRSQASILSETPNGRSSEDQSEGDHKFTMVPMQDAAEMRRRASANKTFVKIVFAATSIVLSFKTDETKKHRRFSIPDCVDFKFKTPEIVYNNKVWGYEDVFEHWKRDTRSYAWSQTGDLLSQLIKKTSVFRSKKTLKHIATLQPDASKDRSPSSRVSSMSSKLRYHVEPPTPQDEIQNSLSLAGAMSGEQRDGSNPVSRSTSRTDGSSHVMTGGALSSPPATISESESSDSEREDPAARMGRTVKGFIGKLRSRTMRQDGSQPGSSEDVIVQE
ncbi:golgi-body localization protein domain-domain-containing protein [Kockovaella imperatae]|uniref:Golgi-body localization protein domain-domain-containing protein n=1 Tax=Kockovaella imperatae TaxID=4999 RepID=A0A1Y1URW7_9TREE|nr:golgi-body localization protein domain-domain-containing protein [Kockovaella imperatae]ORX40254.1 golgi-body localization protein domain-domain-containing protein [Kockovaella imperatae]